MRALGPRGGKAGPAAACFSLVGACGRRRASALGQAALSSGPSQALPSLPEPRGPALIEHSFTCKVLNTFVSAQVVKHFFTCVIELY